MENSCLIYCLRGDEGRLRLIAERRGWTVASVLTESPATAPDRRVGLAAVRRAVGTSGCQAVVVPSLTMLGGSLDEIVETVSRLAKAKVVLFSDAEGIDTTTAAGSAWMAAVAPLQGVQQALRHQKARTGQLRAKEAGVRFGRPPIPKATIESVRSALAAGHGIRPTARKIGISPARVAAEKVAMAGAGNLP